MRTIIAAAAVTLALAGCSQNVQTTSGADYAAAHPEFNANSAAGTDIDRAVAKAAAIEPILRFPARLGLARIVNGELAPIQPAESDAWVKFASAHAELGSFVPLSPLLTAFSNRGYNSNDAPKKIVDGIRVAAAQQHVDAVLIYTVAVSSRDRATPLSFVDLTIVGGYLLPSRIEEGQAQASALLVDVRNGYPYGTAQTSAQAREFVPNFGSETQTVASQAETAAVQKLAIEVGTMATRLRTELAEKQQATLRAQQAAPAPRGRKKTALQG